MLLVFDWFFAENLFFLLTSIVGFAVVGLTFVSFRKNRLMNIYLISLFSIISSRFFLIGSYGVQMQSFTDDLNGPFKILLLAIFPLFYLYFREVVTDDTRFYPRNLLHFIFPIVIYAINFLAHQFNAFEFYLKTINFALVTIIAFNYILLSFLLLRNQLWSKKATIHIRHYQLIRNWTIYFYSLALFVFLRLLMSFTYELIYSKEISGNQWSFSFAALFWLFIFVKVLLSPQILFGMPRLIYRNKTYATSSVLIQPFWEVNDEIVHSDSIDGEQLDFKVLDLISDVDYYAVRAKLFRNKYFSVADLATEVGVPVTHIEYLFNYHSSISFDEYKTHLRIQDALHLIRDGFLKTRSESELAALVGFSSVSVFSDAFFAAVGKNPSDCMPLADPDLRIGSEVLV